jgi:UPF0755 protein
LNRKVRSIILISFIVLVSIVIWGWKSTRPVAGTAEKPFFIKEEHDFFAVAKQLKAQGFIKNKYLFYFYGSMTGNKVSIKPGEHTLKQGLNYNQIFRDLVTLEKETDAIEFIFPEGYNIEQIASRLANDGIIEKLAFLKKAKSWNVLREEQREKLGLNKGDRKEGTKYAMEGMLFPDTYFFDKNMNPEVVIQQMADRFIEETADIKIKSDLTPYEWITLASIIEKEALLNKEKPIIAGVFMNRIEKGQKLQSCSTVQYLLDKPKARLLQKDLKIINPYNTYLNEGLPPAPIASPDLASLKAAADPKEHDYYYFVAKQDGTWSHYFSKTYKEHRKYTRLSGNY